MLKVKAREEQIVFTENLLNTVNFAKRGDGSKYYNNGNKEEQFVGILTQVIISDMFHKERPHSNSKGDRGVDFKLHGIKIDVKSMSRHCDVEDTFIHNLHGDQTGRYYINDVYLFCSLNKTNYILTICGWVTKDEFFDRSTFYPCGTLRKNPQKTFKVRSKKGLYEIKNKDLEKFNSTREFRDAMSQLSKHLVSI